MIRLNTVSAGVEFFQGFIRGSSGPSPLEGWYVGISHDGLGRLNGGHGLQNSTDKAWARFPDETMARGVESALLKMGLQGGKGGGTPGNPPLEVYIFRLPKGRA